MLRLVVACSVLRGPLAFRDSVPKSSPPRRVAPWRRPRAFMTATLDSVDAAFLEAEAFKEEDEEERAPAATSRAREWFDGALAAAGGARESAARRRRGAGAAARRCRSSRSPGGSRSSSTSGDVGRRARRARGRRRGRFAGWVPDEASGEASSSSSTASSTRRCRGPAATARATRRGAGPSRRRPTRSSATSRPRSRRCPSSTSRRRCPCGIGSAPGAGARSTRPAPATASSSGPARTRRRPPRARDDDGARRRRRRRAPARLHVVHVRSAGATGVLHPRTVVHVGDGARVALRESFVAVGPAAEKRSRLTNARTNCRVGAGGVLTHVLDSQEADQVHVHHVQCGVRRDGEFRSRAISDGAAVGRVAVEAEILGPHARFDFLGLQLGAGDQNLDLRTALRHTAGDAESVQDIRNVAGERAKLTFKGRIAVPVTGQKTNADQICKSLLLDDGATVNAMPSLEIVADDVKCTHGATIADLDEEGLFYLNSRMLSEKDARKLLRRLLRHVQTDLLPPATVDRLDAKLSQLTV
ncbi:hypothetical protein JL720_6907 [Aureococcus anophagefferens]|nr:hypothetical protein JL720_6907 [Aureococcus anophagefferens]